MSDLNNQNKGVLCYLLDGKEGKLKAGESTVIPPRHLHTVCLLTEPLVASSLQLPSAQFWSDPESGVDLDVNITVRDGPNHGYVYYSPPFLTILVTRCRFDESFVRNFYGYLSSVTMQGLSPNPLQMLAFMDGADVVLVFPLNIGRLLNVVLGRWFGRWLAGYQTEYKEFAED